MIKFLVETIVKFIDGGYKRVRYTSGKNTVVIYQVLNKQGVSFTRIDIFTKL